MPWVSFIFLDGKSNFHYILKTGWAEWRLQGSWGDTKMEEGRDGEGRVRMLGGVA